MESGSNKSLYTLIAVVVFGIFLSLSYWLFQDNLKGVLADVMEGTSQSISTKLVYNGSYATESKYFAVLDNGDGTCKITGYSTAGGTVVNIPESINGLVVTGIGEHAFSVRGLTSVIMPDTILQLDHYAFSFNPNLTSVILSNKLTYIGFHAFNGCKLSTLTIPTTVTGLGHAFVAGNPLKELNIPLSMKSHILADIDLAKGEPVSRILLKAYVWNDANNTVTPATYYDSIVNYY